MEVACDANVTISNHVKQKKRSTRRRPPAKAPEKAACTAENPTAISTCQHEC